MAPKMFIVLAFWVLSVVLFILAGLVEEGIEGLSQIELMAFGLASYVIGDTVHKFMP